MKERIHYVQVCGIGFDERTGRGCNAPLPVLLRISLHSKIEKPLVSISGEQKANFGKACVGDLPPFTRSAQFLAGKHVIPSQIHVFSCFSTFTVFHASISCEHVASLFDGNSLCSVVTFQSFTLLLRLSARLHQAGGGSSFWTQLDSNLRAELLEQGCAERVRESPPSSLHTPLSYMRPCFCVILGTLTSNVVW